MGNCLRELDRFLHILLEERAGAAPVTLSLRYTTAHRLGDHACAGWNPAADQTRLRALSRSRICLLHGGGRVRRPDMPQGRWMTAGWCEPSSARLRRYAMGEMLRPSAHDLAGVGLFYRTLADRIVGA
nr:hypothetical protein [Sphingomonas liriopis]